MTEHQDNLGPDELTVLRYVQTFPGEFITETEIARRADGRHRFAQDSHWAHQALNRIFHSPIVAQTSQSAVSRVSNPQNAQPRHHPADWKSAIQQVGNLRYGGGVRSLPFDHEICGLNRLREAGHIESDGQGRYRMASAHKAKPRTPTKFMDPKLRAILEQSQRGFDLSNYA